jgi:chemosensory pili system protein ChpA (sensor histidine kinase/response regulator)
MTESLDYTILLGFVEEATSYLPSVRRGIAAGASYDDANLAYRHIHTIKGASLMIGLPELSELADKVETTLENRTMPSAAELAPETIAALLNNISQIELLLNETAAAISEEMLSGDFPVFDDFAFAETADFEHPTSDSSFIIPPSSFDADPEMLEVFALEAEELLANIWASLRVLETAPSDAAALREIRRSSHTLKGAAGVVGFGTISELAHRMEDLLDVLAERPAASNFDTTALLMVTTDALENLTRGASENELQAELGRLYTRYENLLAEISPATNSSARSSQLHSPSRNYEHPDKQTNRTDSSEIDDFRTPRGVPQTPAPLESREAEELAKPAEKDFSSQPSPFIPARATVRVGLDRLDEIVNLMGETIISRTSLEQRLADVAAQLLELNRNTARLRRIASRLESEYEASTLQSNIRPIQWQNDSAAINFESNESDKHGFDDLEFDRYTEFHQLTRELSETGGDSAAVANELSKLTGDLEGFLNKQRRVTDEMQDKLMRLRMTPIGSLFARLERTIQVAAAAENKSADFVLAGSHVEFDTQVLEALAEPLLHLLRNAVAHGIESAEERIFLGKPERGTIKLHAATQGTYIHLTVSDDGRGLDLDRLREKAAANNLLTETEAAALTDDEAAELVFVQGLSTAARVGAVAGRGVGMDAVKESIERQRGTISLKSVANEGTTVTIRLPLALVAARALVIRAGHERFAVPMGALTSLAEVAAGDFKCQAATETVNANGTQYPLLSLNTLLGLPVSSETDAEYVSILIVNAGERMIALAVDAVVEAREIVVKPFDAFLKQIRGLLGAAVLGDGSIVTVLDVFALAQKDFKANKKQFKVQHAETNDRQLTIDDALTVLIVDDSPSVRRVMSNLVTKTGWAAFAAKDGLEALEMLQTAAHLPDVILSDVEMPRMDGYEFVAALKQQPALKHIPVVMITSRAGDKHRQKALEMGVAEYLAKPYEDEDLIRTIKHLAN